AFDECTPGDADYQYAKKSLELTQRWLDRCFTQFHNTQPKYGHQQSLFPIVQGNTYSDLRKAAVAHAKTFNADGFAIGGLSVGEPEKEMYEITEVVTADLPEDKPRYLMGVGTPINILESIDRGVDMFDCVMPTRNGRNGMLFTGEGTINIRNKKWENDHSPVDKNGTSFVDQYSKAYLRHLIISNEMLGAQIASQHNLAFYLWLVNTARQKIMEGNFLSWKNKMIIQLKERL
ncbi:MAG TPA: tRNA guanosine(34) transglycosylase Tgt, partial [Draconibacterium sp.]|nr:tRNA guanosine(34) transglycosylase Tgt [Draconibacterium sp.]